MHLRAEAEGGRQHQVDTVRLQQIHGTDIRPETPGDQGDDVHEGLGRLASVPREIERCRRSSIHDWHPTCLQFGPSLEISLPFKTLSAHDSPSQGCTREDLEGRIKRMPDDPDDGTAPENCI